MGGGLPFNPLQVVSDCQERGECYKGTLLGRSRKEAQQSLLEGVREGLLENITSSETGRKSITGRQNHTKGGRLGFKGGGTIPGG